MGIEWSLKFKNREPGEALVFIQEHLLDAGFQNLDVDSKRIAIPSEYQGWNDMEFIVDDDSLYCVCHLGAVDGERLVEQIRQKFEENGFDFSLEEL